MNWDVIGVVSEAIGAAAVVASLLYVAIQIRHSANIAESDAFERSTQNFMSSQSALLDPKLGELFLRGKENYDALDDVERLHFQIIMSNLLYEMEITMEKREAGLVTDDLMEPYYFYFEDLVSHPGVKEYLQVGRNLHSSLFRDWLDKVARRRNLWVDPELFLLFALLKGSI